MGNSSQNGQLSNLYSIKHMQDKLAYQYRIIEGYRPVKDGNNPILSTDFKWRFRVSYTDDSSDDYYELIYTPTGQRYCYYF